MKFLGHYLILQKVKTLFTIATFMFEFCVNSLQHIFDRVVLITDLVLIYEGVKMQATFCLFFFHS